MGDPVAPVPWYHQDFPAYAEVLLLPGLAPLRPGRSTQFCEQVCVGLLAAAQQQAEYDALVALVLENLNPTPKPPARYTFTVEGVRRTAAVLAEMSKAAATLAAAFEGTAQAVAQMATTIPKLEGTSFTMIIMDDLPL